jgi:hypothetical protein
MSISKLSLVGKIFCALLRLLIDIPAGDRKIANFFTVYGSVSPGVLDVLVDGKPGGTQVFKVINLTFL